MPGYRGYAEIQNPEAYARATEARIKNNARKTKQAKFLAIPENKALVERMTDAVYGPPLTKEMDYLLKIDYEDRTPVEQALVSAWQKLRRAARASDFIVKMWESYEEWGSLTEKQVAAVQASFERDDVRQAERAAKRAEEGATSKHLGTVGERREWTLTIKVTFEYESDYGYVYGYIMNDEAGNVVVFKGTRLCLNNTFPGKGTSITMKATVKKHDERDGVKQTIVNRPKLIAINKV